MKRLFIILSVALMFPLGGCDESRLDLINPNQLSAGTFYATEAQAIAAVNGVYANLQSMGLWRRQYFFLHDLLSDELFGMGSLDGNNFRPLLERTMDPTNGTIGEFWRDAYLGIQRSNQVLDNLGNAEQEIEGLSDDTRNRLLAEVRYLRALMYFEVVSLFGDAPLYTTVSTTTDGAPRSPSADIYNLIMEDLDFAQQHLPVSYGALDVGRVTMGAAYALEGRVWLFRAGREGNASYYQNAKEAYEAFEQNTGGRYSLMPDYFSNFTEEDEFNDESIFEVSFSLAFGGSDGWSGDASGVGEITFRDQEYGMAAWRNVTPSIELVNSYEPGDLRQDANFYEPCDLYNNGQDTVYTPNDCPPPPGKNALTPDDLPNWKKYHYYYKSPDQTGFESGINFRVIRYAEVLLSHAEAIIETEGVTQEALDKINLVRSRAGLDGYTTADFATREAAIEAIMNERRWEFAGEQIRYRDLLRRDLLQETVGARTSNLDLPKHYLLPIPQSEIDFNTALSNADQNPGY